MRARGGAPVRAAPGGTATAVFHLRNGTGVPQRVVTELDLPAGWRPVAPQEPLELAPGAGAVRLAGFAVPGSAAAGAYRVRLRARTRAGAASSDSVPVVVAERRDLRLRVAESPDVALAGQTYTARFLLANHGNAAEVVQLRPRQASGFLATVDSQQVTLAPGAGREIVLTVRTPADLRQSVRHRAALRAVPADTSRALSALAEVEVAPRGGARTETLHRLPVELRLRSADPAGGGAPRVTLSGAGRLTHAGSTRLDFLFRGREARPSWMGDSDEYRVGLRGSRFDLLLGDQVYALSRLTEPGRYASGGGASFSAGPFRAGGYLARDRRTAPGDRQQALSLGLTPGRGALLQVSYLARTGRNPSRVASLSAEASPLPGTAVSVEYGSTPDGRAHARAVSVSGSGARYGYGLRHVRGDDAYPGPYGGARSDEAYLSLSPAGRLRLDAVLDRREFPAPSFPEAPAIESARTSARVSWGNGLSAEVLREARSGSGSAGPFARRAESLRLSGTYRVGPATLVPSAEAGTTRDLLDGSETPFRRFALTGGVSGDRLSLSGTVERMEGRRVYADAAETGHSASVHASARVSPTTQLQLSLQRREREGAPGSYRRVDVAVEQALPLGHRLILRGRSAALEGVPGQGPQLVVDYVAPLAVPVSRRGDRGSVVGRLVDLETGQGLAGVPVRVGGRAAVTDGRGRWAVEGLPPGMHSLTLDRHAVGLERVPDADVPLAVHVEGGGTRRVEIGLVRSGRVAGVVRQMAFEEGGAAAPLREEGGMGNLVIRLAREGEQVRRVTDREGRFAFGDLRPGPWVLIVEDPVLPPHHVLERDFVPIELSPGAQVEVALRVVPRHRPLVMVDGGRVALGAPARTTAAGPAALRAPTPAPETTPAPAATTAAVAEPVAYEWYLPSYVVAEGDAGLAAISLLYYLDEVFWVRIWLANRDVLPHPDALAPGMVLRIPGPGPLTSAEREAAHGYRAARR